MMKHGHMNKRENIGRYSLHGASGFGFLFFLGFLFWEAGEKHPLCCVFLCGGMTRVWVFQGEMDTEG